jgi:intron-binding protein aquarius
MPNSKRLKGSGAAKPQKPNPSHRSKLENARPTPAEVEEQEHPFVQLARKSWLKSGKKNGLAKVKSDVLKQGLWDVLEREGFQYKSLRLLESLQTLERYVSLVLRRSTFNWRTEWTLVTCGLATLRSPPTFMCFWSR